MTSYLIFQDCIPIKGWYRSLIQDNTRSDYNYITQELLETISSQDSLSNMNLDKIEFEWLIQNEYVFDNKEIPKECFPSLILEWKSSSIITNAIINNSSINILNHTFSLLSKLKCTFADIIIDSDEFLHKIDIQDSKKVKFFIPFNKLTTKNNKHHLRIYYNAPRNEQKNNYLFTTKSITTKPITHPDYFTINIKLYTESQAHHTYFNRKLYIGEKGEIKNAPECEEEFGYIQDIKNVEELQNIISKPAFQKYWFAHKELVDVCKDCEFRHMCVDNRLPYQRKDGSWYHKNECNYNPYICKWTEEKGYQTLAKCGIISDKNGFSINSEKVARINKMLWEKEESKNA